MANEIQLFPMNNGQYGRGVVGSGDSWPPALTVTGGPNGGVITAVNLTSSVPDPDPYTGYTPPPDGYNIVLSGYQLTRELFVFDISNVDWGAMDALHLTIDGSQQGGFINAFEIANPGNPNTHPMAPVHSNVHALTGDWLMGSFAELENINDMLAAYPNLVNMAGTAFSGHSMLDWFDPLYVDDTTGTSQILDPRDKIITLSGWEVLQGNDWAGLLIGVAGEPSWFSGQFDIDTVDPEANPVTWTFYNVYNDYANTGYNPVFGVSLNVIPAEPDDEDPQPLPDIAISATATLGIDGPLLRVGGLAESPPDRPILSHAARRRRGW